VIFLYGLEGNTHIV